MGRFHVGSLLRRSAFASVLLKECGCSAVPCSVMRSVAGCFLYFNPALPALSSALLSWCGRYDINNHQLVQLQQYCGAAFFVIRLLHIV